MIMTRREGDGERPNLLFDPPHHAAEYLRTGADPLLAHLWYFIFQSIRLYEENRALRRGTARTAARYQD